MGKEFPHMMMSGTIVEFVSNVMNELKEAQRKTQVNIVDPVEFELSAAYTKDKNGKIDLKIVGAGETVAQQNIQKIKFKASLPEMLSEE